MRKFIPGLMLWLFLLLGLGTVQVQAQADDDARLLERYAPVFYFHPEEYFRPQPTEVMLPEARLRRQTPLWFDVNILARLKLEDFLRLPPEKDLFLDVWYGSEGGSATDYTAHRSYYQALLSPEAGGPEPAVYGRVHRDAQGHITVQYWAFYYYNDWFNKHEGDWEMLQVMLEPDGAPRWIVYSQHHGGTRRAWEDTPRENGTHPVVYVAKGSHANYFAGPESYPNGVTIGKTRIELLDRTGKTARLQPRIIRLPERPEVEANPQAWPGAEWLPYRGRWGEAMPQGDFSGPYGPADKGTQWDDPYTWGLAQPLDVDVWYAHRLRVVANGPLQVSIESAPGQEVSQVETLSNGLLLHSEPPQSGLVFKLRAEPGVVTDLTATWPNRAEGLVTLMRFEGVTFNVTGEARLFLGPQSTRLVIGAEQMAPTTSHQVPATWDSPDLVWMGSLLSAQEVAVGLGWILIGSILPALVLTTLIYNLDYYEREPKRLVSLTFVWGAIPAVLVLLGAYIFFRLPTLPLTREAHIALRSGVLSAVAQELVKGAAVLFIAWRYRHEFDGVFDGLVYGSAVGFGFAMMSNLLRQLSDFVLWGFSSMTLGTWTMGVLFALHHAMYTALFGAALGWARLRQRRLERLGVPLAGMVLSILVHLVHLRWLNALEGFTLGMALLSLLGLLFLIGIGAAALWRQRTWLSTTLPQLLPPELGLDIIKPGRRWRHEIRALFKHGLRAWRSVRRFNILLMEWAFKEQQSRLRPDEPALAQEATRLRTRLTTLWSHVRPYLEPKTGTPTPPPTS